MAKSHNSAHGHLDQNQVTSTRADLVTVNPQALSGPLPNPGIGIESFHAAWGETLTDEQYPQTGVEYYRFYWNELEPAEGEFNFALIDEALQQTRRTDPGMTLGLRFMALADPSEGTKVPQWLIDKGVKGDWVNNGQTFVPDLSDPLYQSYVQSFLNAIGEQYDGNPHISHVDIGM
ncbi:MAG: beta-galactosidase, partial [Vibrio sp.]